MIFTVKVIPSSGKQQWVLDKSGTLKCYLKSAPEQGKANKELIKFLAQSLKISQDSISIIMGAQARTKTISIPITLSQEQLLITLGIEVQHALL